MILKQKWAFVEGDIDTDTVEMVSVAKKKYVEVDLCFRAGMNIPFATIKLHSRDLFVDADEVFEDAASLGEEIARRWNAFKKDVTP